jgi:sulfoxide reductase catalytic subunit YedY
MAELRELREQTDALEGRLSHADDRLNLSEWLPPQWGEMPRIRFWKRWYNVLWIIPIGIAVLVIGVPVCQELRHIPAVRDFIARYPGQSTEPIHYTGFPLWLRCEHYFNLFLMFFIIRAGIQILADHPRLYWD